MPISGVKNKLTYSSNLFKSNDETPMVFYVYPSSDSNDIVQLIEGGGGVVINDVDDDNRGAIYLSSGTKNLENRTDCICTSFIYSCCFTNKLLDIDEFRLQLTHRCSCQSPCKHLDKGNALGESTISKMSHIRTIVKYMYGCEILWKTIEESKECGVLDWRAIRNTFNLWVFLQLNTSASKDSIFKRNDKDSCKKRTNDSSSGIKTKENPSPVVCADRLAENYTDEMMKEDVTQNNLENRALETATEGGEKNSVVVYDQLSCKIKLKGKAFSLVRGKRLTEKSIDKEMKKDGQQTDSDYKLYLVKTAAEVGGKISGDVSEESNKSSSEIKIKGKTSTAVCAVRSAEESADEDAPQTDFEIRTLETAAEGCEKTIGDVSKPSYNSGIKVQGRTCPEAWVEDLEDESTDEDVPQKSSENRVLVTMDVSGKNISTDIPEQSLNSSSEMMVEGNTSAVVCAVRSAEESADEEMVEDAPQTDFEIRALETVAEGCEKTVGDVSKPLYNSGIEVQGRTCPEAWVKDFEDESTDEDIPQKSSENRVLATMGVSGKNISTDFPEQSLNSSSEMMVKGNTSTVVCAERLAEENADKEMSEDFTQTNLENRTLQIVAEGGEKISVDVSKPSHNSSIEAQRSPIVISGEDLKDASADDDVPQISVSVATGASVEKDEVVKSLTGGEAQRKVNCEKKDQGTSVGSSRWLCTDNMRSVSSTSGMFTPLSEDENVEDTQDDMEKSGSDGNNACENSDDSEEGYPKSKPKKRKQVRLYEIREDLQILHWIITRRRRVGTLSGNRIWKFMERREVLPNRTWQSMKERFKRHILPNLRKYPLSNEDRRKLKNELC